ncbi:MAG: hypothetical protein ABEI06_03770 [Halobacteriaceae archaeon]
MGETVNHIGIVGDHTMSVKTTVESAITTYPSLDIDIETGTLQNIYTKSLDILITTDQNTFIDNLKYIESIPVLPLETEFAWGISRSELENICESLIQYNWRTLSQSVIKIVHENDVWKAFGSITVITYEPARISEYSVHTTSATFERIKVSQFRSDGIVIATPAGSNLYNHAAGGPILDPTSEVVAVTPIAPFTVNPVQWALTPPLSITIERDEGDVALYTDGNQRSLLTSGQPIRFEQTKTIPIVIFPESPSPFTRNNKRRMVGE